MAIWSFSSHCKALVVLPCESPISCDKKGSSIYSSQTHIIFHLSEAETGRADTHSRAIGTECLLICCLQNCCCHFPSRSPHIDSHSSSHLSKMSSCAADAASLWCLIKLLFLPSLFMRFMGLDSKSSNLDKQSAFLSDKSMKSVGPFLF